MRKLVTFFIVMIAVAGCQKKNQDGSKSCNIQKTYEENASKVTVTNGIWGTVAFMQGNCMPIADPKVCTTCPVKRTVRIYEYTTTSQASPQTFTQFYNSFNTVLVKQIETDGNGFFQTSLTPGKYTIVVIENGKLYAFGGDGQNGISVVNYTGGAQKVNLTLTYKAVF